MYLMEYPFAYRIPYSILSYIYIHTHTYTLKIPFIQDLVEYPIDMVECRMEYLAFLYKPTTI